jgi:hypothetical protein
VEGVEVAIPVCEAGWLSATQQKAWFEPLLARQYPTQGCV